MWVEGAVAIAVRKYHHCENQGVIKVIKLEFVTHGFKDKIFFITFYMYYLGKVKTEKHIFVFLSYTPT